MEIDFQALQNISLSKGSSDKVSTNYKKYYYYTTTVYLYSL